jgi:hypothetical protein
MFLLRAKCSGGISKLFFLSISLATAIFFATSTGPQIKSSDYNLIGAVKSVSIEQASVNVTNDKKLEGRKRLIELSNYDPEGKLTRKETYPPQPRLTSEEVFTYDNKGKLIQAEKIYPRNDASNRKVTYNHDADGILIEAIEYGSDRAVLEKMNYKYAADSNQAEEVYHLGNDRLRLRRLYLFDHKRRTLQESHFGSDNKLQLKKVYSYGDAEKPVRIDEYDLDGFRGYSTVKYDDRGNRLQHISYAPSGTLELKVTYSYDEKANLKEEVHYERSDFRHRFVYEYEYDAIGNWVRKFSYKCSQPEGTPSCVPFEITYRTISYYDKKSSNRLQ